MRLRQPHNQITKRPSSRLNYRLKTSSPLLLSSSRTIPAHLILFAQQKNMVKKQKGKGKHHKKRKSSKATIEPEEATKQDNAMTSTTVDNDTPNVTTTEEIVQKKLKRRRLSPAMTSVLRPSDANAAVVVSRSESRQVMSYIKFMFLGRARTNAAPVAKSASSSSSSISSSSNSDTSSSNRRRTTSSKADTSATLTTFPCAFERVGQGNGPTLVVNISPASKFRDVQISLAQASDTTAAAEGVDIESREMTTANTPISASTTTTSSSSVEENGENAATTSAGDDSGKSSSSSSSSSSSQVLSFVDLERKIQYEIIDQADWNRSMLDFHAGRRRVRRDVLETYVTRTLSSLGNHGM